MKPLKQTGSGIAAENVEEVLSSAKNAGDKGSAQFYTPRGFGTLCARPLPEHRACVVDLNCGRGDLLFAAANKTTHTLIGTDLDNRASAKQEGDMLSVTRCVGDLTKLFPLMVEIDWKADLIVLNPPWDLHWYKDRLASLAESDLLTIRHAFQQDDRRLSKELIDSTCATIMIALDRMTHRGEGMVIANDATMERLLFGPNAPYSELARHCWARISIKGNPMTDIKDSAWTDDFTTGVIYFAKGHIGGVRIHERAKDMEEFSDIVNNRVQRFGKREGPRVESKYQINMECPMSFSAMRDEWKVQVGESKPRYNIWLEPDGTIGTYLSVFHDRSVKVDKEKVKRLFKLKGEKPMQLVMQAAQRAELMWAVKGGIWQVHPDLTPKVDEAVLAYHAVRAPLTPLSDIQRLGYLDEEKWITCKKTLYLKEQAGEIAPLALERANQFLARPNRGTWDELHSCLAYGGRTVWQLVLRIETDFQKEAGERDDDSECTCHLGHPPCAHCTGENDLSVKWKRIPKVETIKNIIYRTPVFSEGNTYPIRTKAVRVQRKKWKPSLTWGEEEHLMNGMELAIWILDDQKNERLFMDRKHDGDAVQVQDDSEDLKIDFHLQDIAEHFNIPAVPSVAECNPDKQKLYAHRLMELENALNELAV